MNVLKIAFLGSALVFSGVAVASYAAPEGNGNSSSASYAAPEGNANFSTASYAAPEGNGNFSSASYAAPEGTAIPAMRNEGRSQGSRPGVLCRIS